MSAQNAVLELEELVIRVTYEGSSAKIVWQGVSEIQDPEVSVGAFLRSLLPNLAGKSLSMDFRPLAYMNSATLQPLFQFLKELNLQGIATELRYTNEIEWQRISFRSIKAVATTLPKVTVVAA